MARVFLSLGSNLGEPYDNIVKALDLLKRTERIFLSNVSTFYQTKPVGGPPQPDYLNAAVEISTDLSPKEVLRVVNDIEEKLGRKRLVKDGPRTIDLDILLFDNLKVKEPDLQIPHPRMREREFVLKPLSEIAPDLVNNEDY